MPRPCLIPGAPDGLLEIINRHRAEFAGFRMETDPPPETPPPGEEPAGGTETPSADPPPGEEPLGEKGIRALRAEREKNSALARANADLAAKMDAIVKAVTPDGGGAPSVEDALAEIQRRLDAADHDKVVEQTARRLGITNDEDVDFLRSMPDAAAMAKLGERLRANAASSQPPAPTPDPGQGSGHGSQPRIRTPQEIAAKAGITL